ncbi:group II intron reverse transcriptase/maturase [Oscillibacter sp.]|jgi:group II intron reverse transcriptase/maturase|uniref:group II intron reverse transcriptase/maturase n=1 Tax=Oscillibacter sp. TaxID=1945593 RepID=UPI0028A1A21A|nr:group II intron reverse transcriptase/maturase [Oscillibacter sp.]
MATKDKAQKKAKLRHAEYYDFQEIQDELYADGLKGREFKHLVDIISLPENIRLAYRNIKANRGSKTAGTDGRTIRDLEKLSDEKLVVLVQRKLDWYEPQSVRRVEIPKGNDPTKKRPLGIPTILDRLIQQCVLQVLEPICEAKFHDHSYGFRPNRSQEHAVAAVYKNIQISHYYFVVDVDIKGFFDNVNHGKLLKQMWTLGIRDKKLLSIISAMLKAEVAEIGFPEKGTPQGGIISPLLSNIVLNELDWWVASQWEEFPTRKKYATGTNSNGSANKGNKYKMLRDYSKLKEVTCVRYADDFKLFTKNYQQAKKLFYAVRDWLKGRLGLDISPEKSKIVNLRKQYSEFLGLRIKAANHGGAKRPKLVVESHIKEKSLEKIKSNLERLIHNIEFPGHKKRAEYEAVSRYNSYVIGVHNYYSMATMVCDDLNFMAFSVQKSLKARMNERLKTAKQVRKRKLNYAIPEHIKERYGQSKQLRFVDGYALAPIGHVQHKNPMHKRRVINSYTPEGREAIHKALGKNINTGIMHYLMRNPIPYRSAAYNDNRISLYCAQFGKCAVTGEMLKIGDIHCHHKLPRYLGGTDEYKNLVIVGEDIHRLIHATNPETIRKYMEKLNLTSKQLKKLEKLRSLAHVESCLQFDAIKYLDGKPDEAKVSRPV